ncbi:hypothetical protein [Streptomyces sp. B6B3]|uniref:hypothetical protein n=1 Tax=Streptomyces sp. B6B3 TaxID=3153570 RepID=UPI00325C3DDC
MDDRPRTATPATRTGPRRRHRRIVVALVRLGIVGAVLASLTAVVQPERTAATQSPDGDRAGTAGASGAATTTSVAVFDRQTGEFTEQRDVDRPFRAASVVKLLIALDFLWDLGPTYDVPAADRERLTAMLRSSDDGAASHYWAERGGGAIVERMVDRLALTGTVPPPATHPTFWGYAATTAADTVRVYRHLLDVAPAPVRDLVLGSLREATRCAADGFDQYFGIASAFQHPWAVKQGWSGFTSGGCTGASRGATAADDPDLDLVSEALHTTGTVGEGDRSIVAVFTLHPDGTPYGTAYREITDLVRSLNVPGAELAEEGAVFPTWGSGVRVRSAPLLDAPVVATVPTGAAVRVTCQRQGDVVTAEGVTNDWWAYLPDYGGYITNIYIDVPESQLPGVPGCP